MTRPNWSRLYSLYAPRFTCPMSRHVKVISEGLRKGPMREELTGFDPDHMAEAWAEQWGGWAMEVAA